MDLQDFESELLYFDLDVPEEVTQCIQSASEHYGDGEAEPFLDQAYSLAPENLTVLVALYRFYYYQHRYDEALAIAFKAMQVVAPKIGFPAVWHELTFNDLANGVLTSFTLVRFYLMALKGAAYLNFRRGDVQNGAAMLRKVIEMDTQDRLGAKALLHSVLPVVDVTDTVSTAAERS